MAERLLSDWLKSYMEYTSYSESPESFHFWTGVATIAGALRRKVFFDQTYYQWTPNFYIIFVAPPGMVSKSTSMGIGMNLLKEVPDIRFGPNAITWQMLVTSLAESTIGYESKVNPGEFQSMSCLTFASSELGTLLDPRDRSMVDLLVDLWDGAPGAWKKATKTSGQDTVVNPWLNIVACTTPTWIAENLPKQAVGGGFTSRCIFVFAKEKRQLVAYPKDNIPAHIYELRTKLIHDLEIISQIEGEAILTPEAKKWGERWYREHYGRAHKLNMDQFGGYVARKQCHVHKLAMVLAASRQDNTTIEKIDLENASAILTELEGDLPQVFRALEQTDDMEGTNKVLAYIRQRRVVKRQDVFRMFLHMMGSEEFNRALNSGLAAGLLRITADGNDHTIRYIGDDQSPEVFGGAE